MITENEMLFIRLNEIGDKIDELLRRNPKEEQKQLMPKPAIAKKMYPAVCSECKQDCQIPFKASPDYPVKCTSCYMQEKSQ